MPFNRGKPINRTATLALLTALAGTAAACDRAPANEVNLIARHEGGGREPAGGWEPAGNWSGGGRDPAGSSKPANTRANDKADPGGYNYGRELGTPKPGERQAGSHDSRDVTATERDRDRGGAIDRGGNPDRPLNKPK